TSAISTSAICRTTRSDSPIARSASTPRSIPSACASSCGAHRGSSMVRPTPWSSCATARAGTPRWKSWFKRASAASTCSAPSTRARASASPPTHCRRSCSSRSRARDRRRVSRSPRRSSSAHGTLTIICPAATRTPDTPLAPSSPTSAWIGSPSREPLRAEPRRPTFDWTRLPMIGASMLSPELQAFQADVHAEVKRLVTPGLLFALDRNEIPYPLEFIRAMGSVRLLGVNVRAESGGRGLTIQHDALISEEVGYWGTAAMACARTFTAHVGYVLDRYGSPAVHERYLKPMLAGTMIVCQGMTEPTVGANVAGVRTRLTRDGGGYVLTGQKRFVAGAQTADFILAAARRGEHDRPRDDFVAVCVDTSDPGFLIRDVQCDWHGFRGMGSSWIEFRDVRVEPEQIVGNPGQGWQILMEQLLVERVVM